MIAVGCSREEGAESQGATGQQGAQSVPGGKARVKGLPVGYLGIIPEVLQQASRVRKGW